MIETINTQNFSDRVEKSEQPVLLELWAPWCVYCRRISPALDRLAEKLDGKVAVGKINIDEAPELAEKLGADVVPTLFLYQNGAHGEKLVAPASQAQIESWVAAQTV